ncbi:MAG: glycoside hydrolase family 3 N-terminal domain-containing protein, partial [Stackebrandtia sp.]
DSIMTAHIQFPALDDSGDPATLSKPIMTDLLRGELGYDGVVVTDSLRMEGVRQMYPDEEIPVRALQAGVDLMLMPFDIDVAYNAVLDAVASGELTEERIDESVTRILRLKFDRGIVADPFVDPDAIDDVVGVPEHLEVAQDIADRSTTLVQNNGMLPLSADSGSALVTGWGETSPKTLADGLTARGVDAEALSTGDDPDQEAIDAAVAAAEDKDLVVLTVNNARDDEGQLALAEALREAGKPVAVVALNQPYDVAHMTEVDSYLAAYSYGGAALEAVVRTLFAEVNPSGKLPVTIPTADDPDVPLYEIGHGLSYE